MKRMIALHVSPINSSFHNEGDKKPSLTIWKSKNICKCHVCGVAGDSISLAKAMHKGMRLLTCSEITCNYDKVPLKGIIIQ